MVTRRVTLPFLRSVFRFLPGAAANLTRHLSGNCCVCGERTVFLWLHRRGREMPVCARCLSNSRHRHVARAVIDTFSAPGERFSLRDALPDLAGLEVYEAQSDGAVHSVLAELPGYVCSEYFDGIPSGEAGPRGIRCEDLQGLSFRDGAFDLVITQDVLEHVRKPSIAIREISRVLRAGGHHIFTVPADLSAEKTIPLVDVSGEEDRPLGPPEFHGDSIRLRGALAYNRFGRDLIAMIGEEGMETRAIASTDWDGANFRIYQSVVFISRKR